jgi:hypothetical protein
MADPAEAVGSGKNVIESPAVTGIPEPLFLRIEGLWTIYS